MVTGPENIKATTAQRLKYYERVGYPVGTGYYQQGSVHGMAL